MATVGKKSVMKGLKDTTGLSTISRSKIVSENSSGLNTKDTHLASTAL